MTSSPVSELRQRFPYIYALGQYYGSLLPSYCNDEARLAVNDGVPEDVTRWFHWTSSSQVDKDNALEAVQLGNAVLLRNSESGEPVRVWYRVGAVTNLAMREELDRIVATIRPGQERGR